MEKIEAILSVLDVNIEVETTSDAYEQFVKLRDITDGLESVSKKLREKMFSLAEKEVEPDEKGSYTVQFEDGTGYQKQARTSMSIKLEETLEYVKTHGIDGVVDRTKVIAKDEERQKELMNFLENKYPEYLDEEEVLNEGALEQAVLEGEIPMEDFESLVNRKVTYALIDLGKKNKGK